MEKKYSRKHIGEKWTTNEGYIASVIDGGSKIGYCTIQLGRQTKEVCYDTLLTGKVRNIYHKSVYGIGYIGEGDYKSKVQGKRVKAYTVWANMLKRCYCDKALAIEGTYKYVEVQREWHNYQVFAFWFYNVSNYQTGWVLDKDLLSGVVKKYSEDTCLFLPVELNSFLSQSKSTNTSGITGVQLIKGKYVANITIKVHNRYINKNLGTFIDKQEASDAYQVARQEQANKLKTKYKGIIPDYALERIK